MFYLPYSKRQGKRERARGTTFNPTHDKRKQKRHNELYIATKDVHSRKKIIGTYPTNIVTCMLVDITFTIAHHSFCPIASSHCVVVNTYNNKNRKEILSLPTKST